MQRARIRSAALVVLLALATLAGAAAGAGEQTTVILVRHAEKQAEGDDPALTAEGRERARSLAQVVSRAGVDAIFASQFRRTRETVQPLADELGLQVVTAPVVDAERSSRELARRILAEHAGGTVLVAGHSNTVPLLVQALGAGPQPEIPHERYDDLFVVTVGSDGARVVRLRYGRPSG